MKKSYFLCISLAIITFIIVCSFGFVFLTDSNNNNNDEQTYLYHVDVAYSGESFMANGYNVTANDYYIDCTGRYTDHTCYWAIYTITMYAPDGTIIYPTCFRADGYDDSIGTVIGMCSSDFYGVLDVNSIDSIEIVGGYVTLDITLALKDNVIWTGIYYDGELDWKST